MADNLLRSVEGLGFRDIRPALMQFRAVAVSHKTVDTQQERTLAIRILPQSQNHIS